MIKDGTLKIYSLSFFSILFIYYNKEWIPLSFVPKEMTDQDLTEEYLKKKNINPDEIIEYLKQRMG
jgi:hypothetical protein